ncbi:DinB family protein [Paenibacillus oenotherae]|uniref:DinB family protein n=1 Tax=Paenibacillus oenotherae TaxID=1435645 RepID=A0ABS7D5G3_9BACL|nr:DinB family protein [Paenibacillus oenotherae]MBW7475150.1 DinB family protein [Paenibacillus oenotherae]
MNEELDWLTPYREGLDKYTLEQLQDKPDAEQWSLGQLYNHLIHAALSMQVRSIEACAAAEEEQPLGKTEAGEGIFQLGDIPPVKIKVPGSPEYTPHNPQSKEELEKGLAAVEENYRKWSGAIADINPNCKVEHFALGWMNAQEWYSFMPMHFRHHLRQKRELEERLGM